MVSPAPVNTAFDTPDTVKKLSPSKAWLMWVNQVVSALNSVISYAKSLVVTPSTGFNLTIPQGTSVVTLNPTGTLAAGSIVLPANPTDGSVVQVTTTNTITSLTVTAPTGQTEI